MKIFFRYITKFLSMKGVHFIYFISFFYLVLSFAVLPFYRYITNVDAISYLSIAEKYSRGEFFDAINGVWGVLISWLLVPFLAIFNDHFFAYYILQIFIGLATIVVLYFLTMRFVASVILRNVVGIFLIPIITSLALFVLNPDLLLLFFLSSYLYIILEENFYLKLKNVVLLGFVGGGVSYKALFFIFLFDAHFYRFYVRFF